MYGQQHVVMAVGDHGYSFPPQQQQFQFTQQQQQQQQQQCDGGLALVPCQQQPQQQQQQQPLPVIASVVSVPEISPNTLDSINENVPTEVTF